MNERAEPTTKRAENTALTPLAFASELPNYGIDHGLCEDCYAGLVDVGDAPITPRRRPFMSTYCCACGRVGDTRCYELNRRRSFEGTPCLTLGTMNGRNFYTPLSDGTSSEEATK